jgi:hypothetical protein
MKTIAIGILLTGMFAALGWGQVADGNIVGTVVDPAGAVVPNANVELTNVETGVKRTTMTDAEGGYRFGNLLVGAYTINVTKAGFTTSSLRDVRVALSKTTTANISLNVGVVSTQIEVVDAAALIDTTTASIVGTYEQKFMELPSANNSDGGIYNLSLAGPGVASSGGVGVGYGPSIGGQRPRNNNFTVEGIDNNRKDVTGPVINPPSDAVAELTVLQNQFSAEFGHSSGGQFNVIVRSGTNELHGSMYDYLQNRNLNANDQSAARIGVLSPPRYDQNRLGASAGGPIKKNKWFIFGNYDYNPTGQASTPGQPFFAPTQAGYALLDSMSGISKTNLGILEKYAPPSATAVKTTTVNGVAIPYGIYPVVAPSFANQYDWLISSDFNISEKDQLRGRYISTKISQIDTAATLPIFFTPRPTTEKLGTVSEIHNFSASLFNEVRVAFNRYNDDIHVPDFTFPGLDAFPNIVIRDDLNLNIGPNPNAPQGTIQSTYQIVDNVSWQKGRHDLKFGFDGRRLDAASTFIQRVRGDYEWTNLQGFLSDTVPNVIAQRNVGGKPYSGDNNAYFAFANDKWRFDRHLTVNLGLRYEYNGVAQSMKEFALNSIADVPGVLVFRAPEAAKKNFAPRIGLAYSPGNKGNTSIRAGFGMAYDQIFDNVGTNARPPQATSTVDVTGNQGSGFLAAGGIRQDAVPASLTPSAARIATSSFLPANQQLGYALTWNVGIQREFAKDYTAEIRYVGTKGVHLLFQNQINRNSLVSPTSNLPTYLQAPSQATLDSLTLTTAALAAAKVCSSPTNCNAAWDPIGSYGFINAITAYTPRGNSEYHGLAMDLKKRYARNFLFDAAYTWSRNIDDSTAEVASIIATPRRAQDFNNISAEKATSALDRRHRFTFTTLYETPWFSHHQNAFLRNTAGNWQFSGGYTIESGEWVTPQSGVDTNQNGDSAADRVILNTSGVPGTSSDVTALKNSSGATVAYLANNPTAQFIRAQIGAFATSGRNILATPRIDNIDFNIVKSLAFHERVKLNLRADMYNALNHPQYTLGRINNVRARNTFTGFSANPFIPGNPGFARWDQNFSSNPRIVEVSAKLTF